MQLAYAWVDLIVIDTFLRSEKADTPNNTRYYTPFATQ